MGSKGEDKGEKKQRACFLVNEGNVRVDDDKNIKKTGGIFFHTTTNVAI
jgi:hypothetical protein